MQYTEFINRVRENGITDREHAEQATVATLWVLGERLAGQEPSDLAAQLPTELKGLLQARSERGEAFGAEEFIRRVAAREGRSCTADEARGHVHAVLATVRQAVTLGELDDVRAQLPTDYASLFR